MAEGWAKTTRAVATVLFLSFAIKAHAHDGHLDKIEEGQYVSEDPIDSTLWTHILVQALAWGILFPTGMVLGIIRSKWHVPVQVTGTVLAVIGYFLGHNHKGRQFAPNAHAKFVPYMMLTLISQVIMGIYLKLHLERGIHGKIRKVVVKAHGVVGKIMPVMTWVQFVLGGIAAMGFCRDDHLGQCLAHFIMGGAFIGYGILLTILLLVGQVWLRRTGRSQEFFDSLVIAAWGCVNTFTEHRWGGAWVGNDLQHTTMGIIWWSAGLVGVWLSRKRDGTPKRNLIPGIVIFLTGFGMSAHPQHLPLSTMVHTVFGYTLMAAGLCRIIEISFVLRDQGSISADGSDPNSFQYMTPFLLYASGFLFMGATEEQMQLLSDAHVTHVSYVFILYSIAFLLFLFVNMLLHLYAVSAWAENSKMDDETPRINGHVNGHVNGNGYARVRPRVSDAQEFELEGLTSDEEEEDSPVVDKEQEPLNVLH
ncbi:hypothetical protein P154DRAFT_523714 [Amniculicola lignicola CBS 123094]|uniref:Integral membrane protein-like protein n=1 Tax=Amniculicola lignicola CBS 123094 TaxID=1392246 RepID=A0A6A5WFE5_9PLEO|nr:hypothetical protein P154DRAFT_523714 [Amniculicola lignicola CBS 123094]